MPIYEYECAHCGSFEHSQSIHDRRLERCPKCRRKVQRLISATNFQLKGGGWYSDGYQKKGDKAETKPDSTTGESKPTEAAAPAAPAKKKKTKTEGTTKKASSTTTPASSD